MLTGRSEKNFHFDGSHLLNQKSKKKKKSDTKWSFLWCYDVDRLYVSRKQGEEDLPASKTALTHRYNGLKTTHRKTRWRTDYNHQKRYWLHDRMTITRKQKWKEKQPYGCFKRLINNVSHQKTWTWLRKGNLKRETESLLIAAQNNAIRTNHIKARIDKTQQNSKCRLCGDRDETINHIINECSKLAQKEYKTRHDWLGKVIHWEMWKKFEFDHTNKWYMHNPAPVIENDTHKLLWDFDIHTDHLISARRLDLIISPPPPKKRGFAKLSTLGSRLTTE